MEIMGWEEWHRVPYPEHFADVLESTERDRLSLPNADETWHFWYWETEQVWRDGMMWDTTSCIVFLDKPTGPYYVRTYEAGWAEWSWVDPRHPRCWTCGRFYKPKPGQRLSAIGPCWSCREWGD